MSQEQNVLRCYACDMYQVHIVKKAKKWQCKICNEKQSIQRVYFRGSGQDCRFTAQKLNISKADDTSINTASSIDTQHMSNSNISPDATELSDIQNKHWTKYTLESGYLDNRRISETAQSHIPANDFGQYADIEESKSTWSKYLQRSDSNNDACNSGDHSPIKNSSFEFNNKVHFNKSTDENMWSDILEDSGSDSDVNDVTVFGKTLNISHNNTDVKKDVDVTYKPELILHNKSNSFQNTQSHTETEMKSNINNERPSIFETGDGLDDICLDF